MSKIQKIKETLQSGKVLSLQESRYQQWYLQSVQLQLKFMQKHFHMGGTGAALRFISIAGILENFRNLYDRDEVSFEEYKKHEADCLEIAKEIINSTKGPR